MAIEQGLMEAMQEGNEKIQNLLEEEKSEWMKLNQIVMKIVQAKSEKQKKSVMKEVRTMKLIR